MIVPFVHGTETEVSSDSRAGGQALAAYFVGIAFCRSALHIAFGCWAARCVEWTLCLPLLYICIILKQVALSQCTARMGEIIVSLRGKLWGSCEIQITDMVHERKAYPGTTREQAAFFGDPWPHQYAACTVASGTGLRCLPNASQMPLRRCRLQSIYRTSCASDQVADRCKSRHPTHASQTPLQMPFRCPLRCLSGAS